MSTRQQYPLVLSLFPGIGMLDQAFEEEGFCVVRGPDVLWGGDIRRFHPPSGRFDGIIGGPPCQAFSRLAAMVRHNGHEPKFGNLIPEFERCVRVAEPRWFLMENVPDAPLPYVPGYSRWSTLLNNRQLGETQNRVRRWSFGVQGNECMPLMIETVALEPFDFEYAACGGSGGGARHASGSCKKKTTTLPMNTKSYRSFSHIKRLQGLPADFDLPPFTVVAKCKAVGNGVPLAMGRAMAKAVKRATG
jgi:DNA (cytosine-5)-methyltransferase 1